MLLVDVVDPANDGWDDDAVGETPASSKSYITRSYKTYIKYNRNYSRNHKETNFDNHWRK